MANTKDKGNKYEREVKNILDRMGALVQPSERKMFRYYDKKKKKWCWGSKDNDFYNAFDGMYIFTGQVYYYQVKSGDAGNVSRARTKIKKFLHEVDKQGNHQFKCQIWERAQINGKIHYRVYIDPLFKKPDSFLVNNRYIYS